MKKLIFRKFTLDTLVFFTTSIIIMGLIVWTLQAVNYFDYVTQDGHSFKVYFFYTVLNFPKIINRILPFIYFISLFYIIVIYELKNELSIFWINGISRISFTNNIILFSILLMIFQIFLGGFVSPSGQFKARSYLKNSNVDYFTSLIKEGKFINAVKGLTIFINEKNSDGSYTDIFLDDSAKNISRMIYAKNGILVDDNKKKIFKLFEGKVINIEKSKINVFEFDQINFNLNDFTSNTIVVPKIQEISTPALFGCFYSLEVEKFEAFVCDESMLNEIKQEILKRIYTPIYIPVIAMFCCFLITISRSSINYNKIRNFIFILTFILLVFSETSLRYSTSSNLSMTIYFLLPWIIFILAYLIFHKKARNV
jgi:lipopolysaccharide export system permease protein